MSAAADEAELHKKHEEILGRRAELLRQMESRAEPPGGRGGRRQEARAEPPGGPRGRRQEARAEPPGGPRGRRQEARAARDRNSALLQDVQKLEERLRDVQRPRPDVQELETRYWASVERAVPRWEQILLGGTLHPAGAAAQTSPRGAKQRSGPSRDPGRPPRPKPRPGALAS
ncbi:centrosomal protein 15 [Myripristis murdjan]|uniref:Uncharacterized protein n=1 Tax=Myripristis murdjan TaxID=586833 RepID=A0A667YIX1_9TELE|nr:uncharacterized protein C3orf14 homolog [Myripristis murdjan]